MTTVAPPETAPPAAPTPDRAVARRVLAAVLVVAAAVDLVGHVGVDGLAGGLVAITMVAASSAFGVRPRPANSWPSLLGGVLVAAVGIGTMLRTSTWVLVVDWSVFVITVPLLGGLAAGRRLTQTRFIDAIALLARWLINIGRGPLALARLVRRVGPPRAADRSARAMAVGRGLLLAVPVVVATTLLLASGDAVFASFLHLPIGFGGLAVHLMLIVAGAWLGTALLLQAHDPLRSVKVPTTLLGRTTELTIVLASLDLVFALFAAARSIALFHGSSYVQRTTHLTYANYARSGFFQLLAVAAISAVVLLGIVGTTARVDGPTRRRLVVLGEIGVALTLVIVMAAIRRLGLYQDRFGLTMLRLACTWTAWWLGAVFVIIAVAIAGIGRSRAWLTPAILGSLLVAVAVSNVANPAAIVARANVSRVRAESSVDGRPRSNALDVDYLISLGDDAQPVLLAHLDTMPARARRQVLRAFCRAPEPSRALLDANLSASDAADARATYCPTA